MISLYRKHRPDNFDDVWGQDHIRDTLVESLKNDKVGHAYLFAGPRGTGKTTVARLLAKSLNCPERKGQANPCGKCSICLEIGEGRSVDLIEIDAASNRGIDEIRELRERIAYAPARSKYKVYIIDEVHMLTKDAFNALLKTLEEPPAHAIFILATTELHKIPETILSRCMRFQFRRANQTSLVQLIEKVAKIEKIAIDDEATILLAQRSEGSYRDALTLLGSLPVDKGKINEETIRSILGLPPAQQIEQAYRWLLGGSTAEIIQFIKESLSSGHDLGVLVKSLIELGKVHLLSDEKLAKNEPQLLEQLLSLSAHSRLSDDPTAILAARLINITNEFQPEPITSVETTAKVVATVTDLSKTESDPAEEVAAVDAIAPSSIKTTDNSGFWTSFLEKIKAQNHALYAVLRSAALDNLTDDKVIIAVQFRFYCERLNEVRNRKLIETIARDILDRGVSLECVVKSPPAMEVKTTEENNDLVSTVVNVFELDNNE